MGKSNRTLGDENIARLRAYLDGVSRVPERGGKANMSAIAVASGVDRQVLYRPEARQLIKDAANAKGLGMPEQGDRAEPGDASCASQRELTRLQAQLVTARAEIADLRQRLRLLEHLNMHLTESGILPR